jgi:tetratricopeptide (TPR) repeat protein
MDEDRANEQAEAPLQGWRGIADYFSRDIRTVQRWASEGELPVHRAGRDGGRGVPVYAFASELETWRRSAKGRTTVAADDTDPPAGPAVPSGSISSAPGTRPLRRALLLGGAVAVIAAGIGIYAFTRKEEETPPGLDPGRDIPAEARDLYLRGTYLWNRRTPEGITGAIEALTRALQIYPDYAEAHASLAMTYNLARQYSGMSGWDAYPLAETHARRAVELAPGYGPGHSVLAFVEFHWLWQVQAGLDRFEQARRLDPNDANNLLWYASSLIHVQRYEDALRMLTRAQELDPGNATVHNLRVQAMYPLGRRAEAIALLDEMIRNDPGHPWHYYALALCRLAELDYAGYLDNFAETGDRIGVPRYRAVAEAGLAALRQHGERAMSDAMAALDRQYFERGEALAWDVAIDCAMVGNWQEAVPLLRISFDRHEERLIGVKYHPAFWPIRDRPEYKQILAALGLPTEGPA